jgi:hypothetical protein
MFLVEISKSFEFSVEAKNREDLDAALAKIPDWEFSHDWGIDEEWDRDVMECSPPPPGVVPKPDCRVQKGKIVNADDPFEEEEEVLVEDESLQEHLSFEGPQ